MAFRKPAKKSFKKTSNQNKLDQSWRFHKDFLQLLSETASSY